MTSQGGDGFRRGSRSRSGRGTDLSRSGSGVRRLRRHRRRRRRPRSAPPPPCFPRPPRLQRDDGACADGHQAATYFRPPVTCTSNTRRLRRAIFGVHVNTIAFKCESEQQTIGTQYIFNAPRALGPLPQNWPFTLPLQTQSQHRWTTPPAQLHSHLAPAAPTPALLVDGLSAGGRFDLSADGMLTCGDDGHGSSYAGVTPSCPRRSASLYLSCDSRSFVSHVP